MTSSTAALAAAPVYLVGYRYDRLNVSILRVIPLEDGMEHVEHVGRDHAGYPTALALLEQAESLAKATGSKQVTQVDDRTDVGGRAVSLTFYAGGRYSAPRRMLGTHRAPAAADPRAAEVTPVTGSWTEGQRVVLTARTGYRYAQDRPYEHRECSCHNGTVTYLDGTVTKLTYWMDNSIDATVTLDNGGTQVVTLVAPHGDAC